MDEREMNESIKLPLRYANGEVTDAEGNLLCYPSIVRGKEADKRGEQIVTALNEHADLKNRLASAVAERDAMREALERYERLVDGVDRIAFPCDNDEVIYIVRMADGVWDLADDDVDLFYPRRSFKTALEAFAALTQKGDE